MPSLTPAQVAWRAAIHDALISTSSEGKVGVIEAAAALRGPGVGLSTLLIERLLHDFTHSHVVDARGRVYCTELLAAVLLAAPASGL